MQNLDIKDFSQLSGISDGDRVLLVQSNGYNGSLPFALFSAIISNRVAPTIGDNGNWHIGGVDSGISAEPIAPQMERRADGIYSSTDGGDTWIPVLYFSDVEGRTSEIALSDIDFTQSALLDIARCEAPSIYVVYSDLGGYRHNVGLLEMVSDDQWHMVTQMFHTHYLLNADGTLSDSHSDDEVFTYTRSYHLAVGGSSDIPVGAWGAWKEGNAVLQAQLDEKASIAYVDSELNKKADESFVVEVGQSLHTMGERLDVTEENIVTLQETTAGLPAMEQKVDDHQKQIYGDGENFTGILDRVEENELKIQDVLTENLPLYVKSVSLIGRDLKATKGDGTPTTVFTVGTGLTAKDNSHIEVNVGDGLSASQTSPLTIKLGAGLEFDEQKRIKIKADFDNEIFIVATSLPTVGVENKIYLIPAENSADDNDAYTEHAYIGGQWEFLGTLTGADLSNYYTKSAVDVLLSGKADNATVTELSTTVGNHTTQIGSVANLVYVHDEKITTLEESDAKNSTDISDLKSTVAGHTSWQSNADSRMNDIEDAADKVESNVSTLSTELNAVNGEVAAVKNLMNNKADKSTVTALSDTVDAHEESIGKHATRLTQAEGKITSLQTTTGTLQAAVSSHTTKIEALDTDINGGSGLKVRVGSCETNITSLKTRVTDVESSLDDKADSSALNGYVPTSRTVAGKALSADVTTGDIRSAIGTANGTTSGLVRVKHTLSSAPNTTLTSDSNRYYPVIVDKNGTAIVNVPWSTLSDEVAGEISGLHTRLMTVENDITTVSNTASEAYNTANALDSQVSTIQNTVTGTGGLITQVTNLQSDLEDIQGNYVPKGRKIAGYNLTDDITQEELRLAVGTAASGNLGLVKTTSAVTNVMTYTPCPIVSGVPYYKDTNTTYSEATSSAAGLMSAADKIQVDGISRIKQALTSQGTPLFSDPEFSSGQNSVYVYNNGTSGVVTITRMTDDQSSGNRSGYIIRITTTSGNANPGRGGFYQMFTAKANATFVKIFRAKIPVGYSLNAYNNALGNNFSHSWPMGNAGTGDWKWYSCLTQCGSTGSFSTGGHVALLKDDASVSDAVTWYLSYCNTFEIIGFADLTDFSSLDKLVEKKVPTSRTIGGYDLADNITAAELRTAISTANDMRIGLIKTSYTQNGKNYPVKADYSGNAYVSVPWTDFSSDIATLSSAVSGHGSRLTDAEGFIEALQDDVSTLNTELNAVNGTLNTKQSTITGGATTITTSNLTSSRALVSNSSGKVAVSAVTSTELGYLDGVTSAIQTQLNGKLSTGGTAADSNKLGGVSLAHIKESAYSLSFKNQKGVAQWIRVGEFLSNNSTSNTCMIFIGREYNTPENEGYVWSFANAYYGKFCLTQLSGNTGGHQMTKVRIVYKNSAKMYFDVYTTSGSYQNIYYCQAVGRFTTYDAAEFGATIPNGYSSVEYDTYDGMYCNEGFTGDVTGTATGNLKSFSISSTALTATKGDGTKTTITLGTGLASIDNNKIYVNVGGINGTGIGVGSDGKLQVKLGSGLRYNTSTGKIELALGSGLHFKADGTVWPDGY